MENPRIEVVKNGPLRVFALKMDVSYNEETNEKEERVSFCRCGTSLKQPY
jgi:CDGSH-type Zn-finger protein